MLRSHPFRFQSFCSMRLCWVYGKPRCVDEARFRAETSDILSCLVSCSNLSPCDLSASTTLEHGNRQFITHD